MRAGGGGGAGDGEIGAGGWVIDFASLTTRLKAPGPRGGQRTPAVGAGGEVRWGRHWCRGLRQRVASARPIAAAGSAGLVDTVSVRAVVMGLILLRWGQVVVRLRRR